MEFFQHQTTQNIRLDFIRRHVAAKFVEFYPRVSVSSVTGGRLNDPWPFFEEDSEGIIVLEENAGEKKSSVKVENNNSNAGPGSSAT